MKLVGGAPASVLESERVVGVLHERAEVSLCDLSRGLGQSGILLYVDRSKNLSIAKYSSFVQGQGAEEFAEAFKIIKEIADNN